MRQDVFCIMWILKKRQQCIRRYIMMCLIIDECDLANFVVVDKTLNVWKQSDWNRVGIGWKMEKRICVISIEYCSMDWLQFNLSRNFVNKLKWEALENVE